MTTRFVVKCQPWVGNSLRIKAFDTLLDAVAWARCEYVARVYKRVEVVEETVTTKTHGFWEHLEDPIGA